MRPSRPLLSPLLASLLLLCLHLSSCPLVSASSISSTAASAISLRASTASTATTTGDDDASEDSGTLADDGEVGPVIPTPPEPAGGPDRGWSPPIALPPVIKDPRRQAARPAELSSHRHGTPPLPLLPPGGELGVTDGMLTARDGRDGFRLGEFKMKRPPDGGALLPRLQRDNMRVTRMRLNYEKAQKMNAAAGFASNCLGGPCRPAKADDDDSSEGDGGGTPKATAEDDAAEGAAAEGAGGTEVR